MARLTDGDKRRIEAAVSAAESRTGAEFAVAVARSSDAYAAFPILWAAALALIAGGAVLLARPETGAPLLFSIVATLFVALGLVLHLTPLRHRLAPARVKREQANRLALAQFAEHVQGRTHGKVGVLLFVSLAEHHAQILVERGIADAVPQAEWQAIIDRFTAELRGGRLGAGAAAAIEAAAALLAPRFPPVAGDVDEIPDQVREV